MKKENVLLIIILYNLFIPITVEAYEVFGLNTEVGVGVGLKYGVGTESGTDWLPFPVLKIDKSFGKSSLYYEMAFKTILGSVGYNFNFTKKYSFNSSILAGAIVDGYTLGVKIGGIYSSNGYNLSGWRSSLDLYFLSTSVFDYYDNINDLTVYKDKSSIVPVLSIGYHWR